MPWRIVERKQMIGYILKSTGVVLLVFAVITVLATLWANLNTGGEVPATVTDDLRLPHVRIKGALLHAETFGDPNAAAVIVVHGGPGGNYGDLLNLHRLEDRYHIVFYDQLGAGLSARGHEANLTLEHAIEELDGVVEHYASNRPVRLIGHSWGAMLCAAYIGKYPNKVTQVVLAEPGALDTATLHNFLRRIKALASGPDYYWSLFQALMQAFAMDVPDTDARADYVYAKMTAYFANSPLSGYRCGRHDIQKSAPKLPVRKNRFGAAAYRALFGPDADLSIIAANARRYRGDILFMSSQCSRFIGTAFQQRQMHLFPQATLVEIPDAGHNMFSENPEHSLAAVRSFFTGNRP